MVGLALRRSRGRRLPLLDGGSPAHAWLKNTRHQDVTSIGDSAYPSRASEVGANRVAWKHTFMSSEPPQSQPKKVFVISPIGKPGTDVHQKAKYALKYLIRAALPSPEFHVHRADEGKSPDSIGQHVIRQISEADLIVADLTDHNPNVFYELAIAHGWRKPVVHLISQGQVMPFDIVDQRTIFYDITDLASVEDCVTTLNEYAIEAMLKADELVNPLSSFKMFDQVKSDSASSGDAVAYLLEDMSSRISRLQNEIRRIGRRSRGMEERTLAGINAEDDRSTNNVSVREFQHVVREIRELVDMGAIENSDDESVGALRHRAASLLQRVPVSTASLMMEYADRYNVKIV